MLLCGSHYSSFTTFQYSIYQILSFITQVSCGYMRCSLNSFLFWFKIIQSSLIFIFVCFKFIAINYLKERKIKIKPFMSRIECKYCLISTSLTFHITSFGRIWSLS